MTSDNGRRLETLHWYNPLSRTFVSGLSDFVLIDGTHKTNIYDLSLIVTKFSIFYTKFCVYQQAKDFID